MPDKEGLDWMRSRPQCIKDLLRRFPPGCMVRIKPGAELCSAHDHLLLSTLCVYSYFEDGGLKLVNLFGGQKVTVDADNLEWLVIIGFYTNYDGEVQDHAWVDRILDTSWEG